MTERKPRFTYMYQSHLDLFWLGSFHTCLEQGNRVIKQYVDRCREHEDETYLIESVVFLQHFLNCYPEYSDVIRSMWQEGRLDIGCAYVDVWQNLVLGESHIRNIVMGRSWLRQALGIEVRQAVHPDLPGLTAQTPQMYAKSGVTSYVTARKIFKDGQVWVHEAPDGSSLLMLNQPIHYDFRPFADDETIMFNREWGVIDPVRTLEGFQLGTVMLSAGSSDLTTMETFEARIGRPAKQVIEEYRERYPQYDFGFGSYRLVLEEYAAIADRLPHLQGEIPSVWGVACDESVDFFRNARRLEGKLLTAGLLEARGMASDVETLALSREVWYGSRHEQAHFREKDPIVNGEELSRLWEMHIFSQDHNGGGQEGALSAFQKRTMQERAMSYADWIINRHLKTFIGPSGNGADIVLFNPSGSRSEEPVELIVPVDWLEREYGWRRSDGGVVRWQKSQGDSEPGTAGKLILSTPVEGTGFVSIVRDPEGGAPELPVGVSVSEEDGMIFITTDKMLLGVNKTTGAIQKLQDRQTGTQWGSASVNRLYAVAEAGNDVTLRTDESAMMGAETVRGVEIVENGSLYLRIRVFKEILKAHVEQDITVWHIDPVRIDLDTRIYWHGKHNVQLRQLLPSAMNCGDVSYGSPFYGSRWVDTVPGCGPGSPDEYLPQDYPLYREVQLWVHQQRRTGGLMMATAHPGFRWGEDGLEAVLLRTPASCGDSRFYWENAGLQIYHFRLQFGGRDDAPLAYDWGQRLLCPLVAAVGPAELGVLTSEVDPAPFIRLTGDNLVLSSVQPVSSGFEIRLVEMRGMQSEARLRLSAAVDRVERTTLDGRRVSDAEQRENCWIVHVEPYEIVTLFCSLT